MKKIDGVYSLKLERLAAERQQAVIRVMLAITSSLVLLKWNSDALAKDRIPLATVMAMISVLMAYSVSVWAFVRWRPDKLHITMAVSSIVEVFIITYMVKVVGPADIPFYLWYIFYVVSVATRYGLQYSIVALSASLVSFVAVLYLGKDPNDPVSVVVSPTLGINSFLMVLALMFGQISERQLSYQASLSVVNEFRAELAGLASSREIIDTMLAKIKELLNAEHAFFLPAKRGADASEAPGLRSVGADPALLSTFRERGGTCNVESVLHEQRPLFTNNPAKDTELPDNTLQRLGLRNLAAAPMMVRNVPVGVVYAANKKDKRLSNADLQLLDLIATQAAPVVENALLWERLREAAAAEERLRIARDLHDNFLQTLAAIKLHLERCKILVQKDTARALEGIDRIHQISTRGLAEVRAYLSELRLMGPEPSRFREAIERCALDTSSRGGFKANVEIETPQEGMPPNVAVAAFQIARELLNNAASHSAASTVSVKVYSCDGKLVVEVEDDGVGFEVSRTRAEKASQGHLGLVGVEERARQCGGTLTITSAPGKGTRAVAELSL